MFKTLSRVGCLCRRPGLPFHGINNGVRIERLARGFHASRGNLIKDPYTVLGVDKNASAKDIKKKYYQLAKKFHPDVNKEKDADKKFQEIQASYEILSDEGKRKQFDQFGSAAFDGSGGGGGPGGAHGFGGFGGFGGQGGPGGDFNPFANFSGFQGFNFGGGAGSQGGASFNFEDLFGFGDMGGGAGRGGRSGAGRQGMVNLKGDDIELMTRITLEEAAQGIKSKTLKYGVIDPCGTCQGSGLKQGRQKETCKSCGGSGTTIHLMQGGFQMASTCSSCGGTGVSIPRDAQCGTCGSNGTVHSRKSTTIDIPQGIDDGMRLRVADAGDYPEATTASNRKMSRGDLYVRIEILPHKLFKRDKHGNLDYTAHIPMTTAALGGHVEIPTLTKQSIRLTVPAGTQSGAQVTIPGKGMPLLNRTNMHGDLRVKFSVRTLRPENKTQSLLLEALAEATGDQTARRSEDFGHIKKAVEAEEAQESSSSGSSSDKKDQSSCGSGSKDQPGFLKRLFKRLTEDSKDDTK